MLTNRKLLTIMWLVPLGLVTTIAWAQAAVPDPEDWFRNEYAPLWKADPWSKLSAIDEFYDDSITIHPADGAVSAVPSHTWLAQSIDGWRADGWVSSLLAGFRSDRINPSTVLFITKWQDLYADGHKEFSCGWYVADVVDGRWKFTRYEEVGCEGRDL